MASASSATSVFGVILLASLAWPCFSNHQPQVFLGSHSIHSGPAVSTGELDALLQRQFEEAFGSSSRAGRSNLDAVERALAQMHAALPKNDNGRLAPSVVLYALHRYFAGRHGWLIREIGRAHV